MNVGTYRDDVWLTVNLVHSITEVHPPAVHSSIITMETQEASMMHNYLNIFQEKCHGMGSKGVLVSLVSTVEQQSHHGVVAQAVLQRRGEERVADHAEATVHVCAVGQQQLHEVVPAERNESSPAPNEAGTYNVYLSARTATRMHRRGSSSVLAPAASSNLAQVTSPLEVAKNRGVFLRSP